ncbi:anti-sigma B factor antagonist [Pseudobutyrivibrio sp. ACV-2]|uniref:STAS domain-containing protein n=1 Tax=Pseudobutyrivibrio sp. ACV-2 TaxID=1520801 RepID=UPI00089908EA|nr:STAS domain-containing protein [Pseudobutyrivibrio sp. ACV-2]SEA93691.1 anti-sigma B factor antagonist [Pseudobutyrivibrio sp. ACV-2]
MLNISKTQNDGVLTIELEGRLDTTSAPDLEAVVKSDLDGVKELIFEVRKLEYISSAGLRTFLSAQKIMNRQGNMTVMHPSEEVQEIFDVTGFSDILNIQ